MTFKRLGKGIAALLVIVAIVFVSFKVLGYTEQMKMNSIVNSEEAKGVYEKDLKYIDKDAFTQQGVIQSYEISSFEKNPMGGIIVYLYVNDHKEYTVSVFLEKLDPDGKLFSGGGSWSPQLEQLIKEKNQ
ncbi:MAG: DUF1310 domain-containing protein [Candidatus Granulicatella sp. P6S_S16_bin.50.1]|nr:DUF1310 domain-containing protein [Candidatus Granulicatella sp. P6S_S16_bin.50.1]